MIIQIFDKDEKHQPSLFIIECFDKDKKWVTKAVEKMVNEVHKIDGYTTDDLRKKLDTFGIYPIVRYDFEKEKKMEIGF